MDKFDDTLYNDQSMSALEDIYNSDNIKRNKILARLKAKIILWIFDLLSVSLILI